MTDVFISTERATSAETAAIDSVLAAAGVGPTVDHHHERLVRGGMERRNERRHLLLPCLHALQNRAGWISPGGVNYIAERLAVPPAETFGVATFYELFRTDDPGPIADGGTTDDTVHVCVDAACQLAGSEQQIEQLTAEGRRVHRSPCLGQCERPVASFLQGRGKPDSVPADADGDSGQIPQLHDPSLKLLRRVGRHDPTSLDAYVAVGGYQALAKAFGLGRVGIVDEVAASGLRGRGGAAFPTGVKWRAVAAEDGPKHVVANCDESEPGTFKDRILMENDPFALIEAMTIAAFAVGAEKGWIYVRGEYPLATQRLTAAIEQARTAGFLGDRIARSSFQFDIEVRRGAGAYICGEETALFNSLEGFRGEPRQKPPFPTTNGLFDQPTAINNPETLLNVLDIVLDGGTAFAESGTADSSGPKLLCLSGHVAKPGLYEVPFGPTLGDVLELAGGVTGNMRAVLLGGAAGSFVDPDALDMPLTFEGVAARGASLGSGVVMALDDTTDFDAIVARIAEFFRNESCGQCVPCRVGAVRQHELLTRSDGTLTADEVTLLEEMDRAMKDASICGLGHTAATAVRSAIELGLIGTDPGGAS